MAVREVLRPCLWQACVLRLDQNAFDPRIRRDHAVSLDTARPERTLQGVYCSTENSYDHSPY